MSDSDSWKIPASAEQCTRCETALAVGDEVTVFLRFGDEGPRREDLCASCGKAVSPEGSDVFWRHKLPESAVASPVVDYALLREMFQRMLARPEGVYQRLSYLVALVLVRKRHLRLRGFERRGGSEVMVVSRGAGEPDLDVPAPHLDAEALVETREHLTRLLAADLPSDDLDGVPDLEAGDPGSARIEDGDPGPESPDPGSGGSASAGNDEGDAASERVLGGRARRSGRRSKRGSVGADSGGAEDPAPADASRPELN